MLNRYQSPKRDPSTKVSVIGLDLGASPALSGTDVARTSTPSDSRSRAGAGAGTEIHPLRFSLDEEESAKHRIGLIFLAAEPFRDPKRNG